MNAIALSIMRYQDDINTEHNMKSICRAAVAQWTKRLTCNGYYSGSKLERRKHAFITYLMIYLLILIIFIFYISFTKTNFHIPL